MILVPVIKNCAVAVTAMFPLSLPSPARGEGFDPASLDGRGKGEGGIERNSMRFSPIKPALPRLPYASAASIMPPTWSSLKWRT